MLSLSNLKWPFISLILYANVIFLNVLLRFKCKFNTTKCTYFFQGTAFIQVSSFTFPLGEFGNKIE